MEGYCGKSCEICTWRERLGCPGCQEGPGRAFSGGCGIAACCRGKGHATCATCGFLTGCPTRMKREDMPALRQSVLEREAERRKWMGENAPLLGKRLWVLFWLFIPSEIGTLMTNDTIAGAFPALLVPGQVLTVAVSAAYALVLWKLAPVGKRYRAAALCMLVAAALAILPLAGVREQSTVWWLVSLPGMAVSLYGTYQEYQAHAEVLDGVDDDLAAKWRKLWKWEIGFLLGLFGCVVIVLVSYLLGVLAMLAVLIGILVVAVLKLVYLYRTARLFRDHIPSETERLGA